MALKITTQIGTDKGITSEAYVRIFDYQISKNGSANFRIELFQNEEDSVINGDYPGMNTSIARNQQIGENLYIYLNNQIEEQVLYPTPGLDEDGNPFTNRVETIIKTIPDLSSAQGIDIFTFGYSHLKAKLVDLFGAENVVDC